MTFDPTRDPNPEPVLLGCRCLNPRYHEYVEHFHDLLRDLLTEHVVGIDMDRARAHCLTTGGMFLLLRDAAQRRGIPMKHHYRTPKSLSQYLTVLGFYLCRSNGTRIAGMYEVPVEERMYEVPVTPADTGAVMPPDTA